MRRLAALLAALALAAPLSAKDSLGVFGQWGAFRDPQVPRCYAISSAIPDRGATNTNAYASVGTWPRRGIRGQVHFRLASEAPSGTASLRIGRQRFVLKVEGADAWAQDARMDAAIVAAMRSARQMTISARDAGGRIRSASYEMAGVASALDAATLACARRKR